MNTIIAVALCSFAVGVLSDLAWKAARKTRWYYRARDYARAVWDCPRGVLCGWCGRPNFFFDDCGFFVIDPRHDGDRRVACSRCLHGPLGQAHEEYYGIGER